jgi:hypothetical protein
MWQFQWVLSLIPDSFLLWFINILLVVGLAGTVAGFFIKFIPFVNQYRLPVQIVSVILLVAGVYFKGGYANEMAWRDKVKAAEERAAIAEKKAEETNVQIETKIVERVKKVKEVQYVIQEKIVKEKELIDKDCRVPQVAIDIHNDAAKNRKPEEKK